MGAKEKKHLPELIVLYGMPPCVFQYIDLYLLYHNRIHPKGVALLKDLIQTHIVE